MYLSFDLEIHANLVCQTTSTKATLSSEISISSIICCFNSLQYNEFVCVKVNHVVFDKCGILNQEN